MNYALTGPLTTTHIFWHLCQRHLHDKALTCKNLGPDIMNRDKYIKPVLKERLLAPTYLQLLPEASQHQINMTKQTLTQAFYTYRSQLSQSEMITSPVALRIITGHQSCQKYTKPQWHWDQWLAMSITFHQFSAHALTSKWRHSFL